MDPSNKFGSMEEQIVFLAREFQSDGSLFLPLFDCRQSPKSPTPLEEAGVPIACLDMSRFRWSVMSRLLGLIRQHEIDVVHWNFSPPVVNAYMWWLTLQRPRLQHF